MRMLEDVHDDGPWDALGKGSLSTDWREGSAEVRATRLCISIPNGQRHRR